MFFAMNRPIDPPVADVAAGPLDEHGQQRWSADELADAQRRYDDADYLAEIERGLTDIRLGQTLSHDEHMAAMEERKRHWQAERRR